VQETTSLKLSDRTQLLGFSEIVRIRNRVFDLRSRGIDVLEFQGGEPFVPTPDFVKDGIRRALVDDQTRYAPSSGIGELLSAISTKLNDRNRIPASPADVIVTSGGAHGLFCVFQTTLDPGDDAILLSPYWTPIRDLMHYCGANLVTVPWEEIRAGAAYEAISRRVTPRTKLIYVNTPSNPTGDVLHREHLEAIAAVALERNLTVVSDEAYEDLVYDAEHRSIAAFPEMYPRTISVFTFSKSFSMTGLRVGYLAAAPHWMDALRKIVLNSINGVSTPMQYGALAAITDRSDYLDSLRTMYRERRDHLVAGVAGAGFRVAAPEGAFYLFVDVRERLGNDSWKAMEELLETSRIATVPGVVFGEEGEGHLRMSFSTELETIDRAVEVLRGISFRERRGA
jgi:aspartate aminotransferase